MQINEQAIQLAQTHMRRANPSNWDGTGTSPAEFRTQIHTYAVNDGIELDVSFERDDVKWVHHCELRDKNTGELMACAYGAGINSIDALAETVASILLHADNGQNNDAPTYPGYHMNCLGTRNCHGRTVTDCDAKIDVIISIPEHNGTNNMTFRAGIPSCRCRDQESTLSVLREIIGKYLHEHACLGHHWAPDCLTWCKALTDIPVDYFKNEGIDIEIVDAPITITLSPDAKPCSDYCTERTTGKPVYKVTETNVDGCESTATEYVTFDQILTPNQCTAFSSALDAALANNDDDDTADMIQTALNCPELQYLNGRIILPPFAGEFKF